MKVDLENAQAVVTPAPGKSFDPAKIPKAVKDAGFTPGPVEVVAVGTLASRDDVLQLQMPGPVRQLILAGGDQEKELKRRRDLRRQRLRVTGKLHPSHADRPPGLTVEKFALLEAEAPNNGPG